MQIAESRVVPETKGSQDSLTRKASYSRPVIAVSRMHVLVKGYSGAGIEDNDPTRMSMAGGKGP